MNSKNQWAVVVDGQRFGPLEESKESADQAANALKKKIQEDKKPSPVITVLQYLTE